MAVGFKSSWRLREGKLLGDNSGGASERRGSCQRSAIEGRVASRKTRLADKLELADRQPLDNGARQFDRRALRRVRSTQARMGTLFRITDPRPVTTMGMSRPKGTLLLGSESGVQPGTRRSENGSRRARLGLARCVAACSRMGTGENPSRSSR